MIDITIIITNWNTRQLLLDCIESIYKTIGKYTFEIIVVDNASTDGSTGAVMAQYPSVQVIANKKNEGFARANNTALRRMKGTYAVLLNSDTLVTEGSLGRMFEFMNAHPEAGICGPQLLNRDGSKQTSIGTFPELFSELTSASLVRLISAFSSRAIIQKAFIFTKPAPVDFIIGACMVVRKKAIDSAGMLDEDYFFYYEEIDWCYRMHKAGWQIYHLPEIAIWHFGGQSVKNINLRARVESWRSRYLYFKKTLVHRPVLASTIVALGFFQTFVRFSGYLTMNLLSLFLLPRLRRRWMMFGYLFAWHVRGMPVSMGLPRQTDL